MSTYGSLTPILRITYVGLMISCQVTLPEKEGDSRHDTIKVV